MSDQNLTIVSGEDLAEIDRSQRDIAIRFEKSNEMLENCNAIMDTSFLYLVKIFKFLQRVSKLQTSPRV